MNKFLASFAALVALLISSVAMVPEAEAKRLGGGGSFGMNRSTAPAQRAAPAPTAPTNAAAPAAKPGMAGAAQPQRNRWLGPLAGLAAGIGLAALLSHFGLGEGFASIIMLMLLVMAGFFVFRLLFRKTQSSQHGSLAPAGHAPMSFERTEPAAPYAPASMSGGAMAAANVPAGFDSEGFLRQAKLNFIRLQAANDAGNLDDLKQFLSPEVFAEVQMQYEERGRTKQETDVQNLEAELLEVVTEDGQYIASVRFYGTIREDGGAPASFAEIWHLVKPVTGNRGWQVAGFQQVQ